LAHKNRDDQLTLAGIKIYPRIGVTAEERQTAQECEVDLTIWSSFEAAAATDSMDQSVDYTRLLNAVQEIAAAREYNLVETLAYRIARMALQAFPVDRVRVNVRKRPESLSGHLSFVEVGVEEP
jgi:7,8-dihydroneopterin aldolase/epimerase/oxygenase